MIKILLIKILLIKIFLIKILFIITIIIIYYCGDMSLDFSSSAAMETVRSFLESSSISGLNHISTERKYAKLLWILVVISGFTTAGLMINQSFQSWADSPVKTTIETLPITNIMFPKITVCPPKNTYTDLNYYLVKAENMTLDNTTRKELANYAMELLYDHLYDNIMRNLSKYEDNDRYYNWYHGYTKIELPDYVSSSFHPSYFFYNVDTAASSGSISTQQFGEKFDADKVETGPLVYYVTLHPPASVRNNTNVTLHLDVEMVSMKALSSGRDTLTVAGTRVETSRRSFNFTPPTGEESSFAPFYTIGLVREVLPEDIMRQKLQTMPGFKVTWHYSGMKVESEVTYYKFARTKAFIRNGFNIKFKYICFDAILC